MGVIRSEVVGSLLRPDYLKDARPRMEAGELDAAAFKRIEDRAVDEAIHLQKECGVDVVTDGEQRRFAFTTHFMDAVEGYDRSGVWTITFRDEAGGEVHSTRPVVVEKLRWRHSMCAEEWVYLRARIGRAGGADGAGGAGGREGGEGAEVAAKVSLVGAQQAAAYYDAERSKGAYPTVEAYLADVVDITRREIAELARLGCTYVQIDSPQYAALLNADIRRGYRERGSDPDWLLDQCIELDNAIIAGHPAMTFGLHICRGNAQSMFYASGGYEPIARIFERTRFQRFLLEYDDQRSGDFEPLGHVPEDRVVVLGLVTTKKPELESEEQLKRSIEQACRYVPLERLALSPQCGFASAWAGNRLTESDQRKKLELVARVARAVWGAGATAAGPQ